MTKKKKLILSIISLVVVIAIGITALYLLKKPTLESVLSSKDSSWELTVTDAELGNSLKESYNSSELADGLNDFKESNGAVIDLYSDKSGVVFPYYGYSDKFSFTIEYTGKSNEARIHAQVSEEKEATFAFTATKITKDKIEGVLELPSAITEDVDIPRVSISLKNKSISTENAEASELEDLLTKGNGEWHSATTQITYDNAEEKESSLDGEDSNAYFEFKTDGTGNMIAYTEGQKDATQPFTFKIDKNIIHIKVTNADTDETQSFDLIVDSTKNDKIETTVRWNFDEDGTMSTGIPEGKTKITLTK
ncbi:hypothetical protein [Enterococcus faecalis]|uniref:hypothetical protein n=1 Tax=Enterococcus faecalis TaxID=1351 RepID=UPI002938C01B|nr:hypothetical protein [Enterococcus faecalis]